MRAQRLSYYSNGRRIIVGLANDDIPEVRALGLMVFHGQDHKDRVPFTGWYLNGTALSDITLDPTAVPKVLGRKF